MPLPSFPKTKVTANQPDTCVKCHVHFHLPMRLVCWWCERVMKKEQEQASAKVHSKENVQ